MQEAITSIRLNPEKAADQYRFALDDSIPWADSGYYLKNRPSFTFDPIFHGGAYYVQEASSMLIGHIFKSLKNANGIRVLDLCAAPGGKSTLLASLMGSADLLVSNEVIQSRYSVLRENLMKWGKSNVITTNHDPKAFQKLGAFFDIILIDAPCSGEGLWRKDPTAKAHWSEDHVNHCALRQKRIIADALPALKNGGKIIYSTCTFNDQENIDNVKWTMDQFGLQSERVDLNSEWGIDPVEKLSAFGYQCRPEQVRGEGFFFSVLSNEKIESKPVKLKGNSSTHYQSINFTAGLDWVDSSQLKFYTDSKNQIWAFPGQLQDEMKFVTERCPRAQLIFEVGQVKKQRFIPAHALALSNHLIRKTTINLDEAAAIEFLRKSSQVPVDFDHIDDWAVTTFDHIALGWVKRTGSRLKNYYPMKWRIRKQS